MPGTELRVEWRMARWWACAIMLAIAGVFALLVRAGLRSTGPGVWPHVLIPPFGLWIYATLASLVNRRKVIVTPHGLVMTNGPIPVRAQTRVAREDIVCTYHSTITALADDGRTDVVLGHTCGVETRTGAHVQVFGTFKDPESARNSAQRIADALAGASRTPIEVRHLKRVNDDPADKRTFLIWVSIVAIALFAGFLWDLTLRSPGFR
jgi:hypothetical protein